MILIAYIYGAKKGRKILAVKKIFAIDPGTWKSAFVIFEFGLEFPISEKGILPNQEMRDKLLASRGREDLDLLVLEQYKSYGMPVGDSGLLTVLWSGRFLEAWGRTFDLLPRKTVAGIICHNARANDANIRRSLIDKLDPCLGMGRSKSGAPRPTSGVSRDIWSALAVAVAWFERENSLDHIYESTLA